MSGIVKSSNGESIIGANVTVEGTTIGCITDIDGNFILEDVPDNANLTVSYIGFQTQSVSVIGKSSLNGYSKRRYRDTGGSCGSWIWYTEKSEFNWCCGEC